MSLSAVLALGQANHPSLSLHHISQAHMHTRTDTRTRTSTHTADVSGKQIHNDLNTEQIKTPFVTNIDTALSFWPGCNNAPVTRKRNTNGILAPVVAAASTIASSECGITCGLLKFLRGASVLCILIAGLSVLMPAYGSLGSLGCSGTSERTESIVVAPVFEAIKIVNSNEPWSTVKSQSSDIDVFHSEPKTTNFWFTTESQFSDIDVIRSEHKTTNYLFNIESQSTALTLLRSKPTTTNYLFTTESQSTALVGLLFEPKTTNYLFTIESQSAGLTLFRSEPTTTNFWFTTESQSSDLVVFHSEPKTTNNRFTTK